MNKPMLDIKGEASYSNNRAKVQLVFGDFTEHRCTECKRLLARQLKKSDGPPNRIVEIKCPKCGILNKF